jgi:hypothetical protein
MTWHCMARRQKIGSNTAVEDITKCITWKRNWISLFSAGYETNIYEHNTESMTVNKSIYVYRSTSLFLKEKQKHNKQHICFPYFDELRN